VQHEQVSYELDGMKFTFSVVGEDPVLTKLLDREDRAWKGHLEGAVVDGSALLIALVVPT
jgi:hypothetical protein